MKRVQNMRARIAALLLLAAACLLVLFGAVAPYLQVLAQSQQRLQAASAQLSIYSQTLARSTAGAADTGGENRLAGLLLPGTSMAAAAAYLQQQTGGLAAHSGALLLSFELPPPLDAGEAPLQAVSGRIRVTANTTSLRALLHALESHRPLLLLDNVYVRARSDQDTVPGGHLDVQMDVTGYRQVAP